MSIFDKIREKIGNTIEKFSVKHMEGATREEYDAENNEAPVKEEEAKSDAEYQETDAEIKQPAESIKGEYSKADFSNLEELLKKVGAISKEALWVAGYPIIRVNQNPAFAAWFNKNKFKFLTINQEVVYLLGFKNQEIYSYKTYNLKDVKKVEYSKKLFTNSFIVKFSDGTNFKIAVAANKNKISELRKKLK